MKQGRINKSHFTNWDIDDLQEYVLFLTNDAPKTEGNKYILSLASEVFDEMCDEYNKPVEEERPNECLQCGKECDGEVCSEQCGYAYLTV
jgi:hypothetical protein